MQSTNQSSCASCGQLVSLRQQQSGKNEQSCNVRNVKCNRVYCQGCSYRELVTCTICDSQACPQHQRLCEGSNCMIEGIYCISCATRSLRVCSICELSLCPSCMFGEDEEHCNHQEQDVCAFCNRASEK
jgi:hypothetical protein